LPKGEALFSGRLFGNDRPFDVDTGTENNEAPEADPHYVFAFDDHMLMPNPWNNRAKYCRPRKKGGQLPCTTKKKALHDNSTFPCKASTNGFLKRFRKYYREGWGNTTGNGSTKRDVPIHLKLSLTVGRF
jgi:hypothetical protein